MNTITIELFLQKVSVLNCNYVSNKVPIDMHVHVLHDNMYYTILHVHVHVHTIGTDNSFQLY